METLSASSTIPPTFRQSPVRGILGTIPRFVLTDLPRAAGDRLIVLHGEKEILGSIRYAEEI
jgi:hypothetical protein